MADLYEILEVSRDASMDEIKRSYRRLAREYESKPASSVSRTLWASMANMVRRLTGTSTVTWRNA